MTYVEMKRALCLAPDAVGRLEMVMDFGAQLPPPPDSAECTEITGCSSRVQICRDGRRFFGTADSALVRGIVAIITAMVDGKSVEEIRRMDLDGEFASLHLQLGAGRLGGVNSMIRFLKNL